jgi:hypothetical protein
MPAAHNFLANSFQRHRPLLFYQPVPTPQPTPYEPADDLDQLVKAGLRLVHLLERHVEAAVRIAEAHVASDPVDLFPPRPLPNFPADIGLTFSRIARAVRLTKALQVRLVQAPQGDAARAEAPLASPRAAGVRPARYRVDLQDPDGDAIEPSDPAARWNHDAWERLQDDDPDADILARPVPEILAVIRGDLGLEAVELGAVEPGDAEGPIAASREPKADRGARGLGNSGPSRRTDPPQREATDVLRRPP